MCPEKNALGELKTVRELLNIERFVAMFDARMCCFFTKMRGTGFSGSFSLQPKQLQPDYVSSYKNFTI